MRGRFGSAIGALATLALGGCVVVSDPPRTATPPPPAQPVKPFGPFGAPPPVAATPAPATTTPPAPTKVTGGGQTDGPHVSVGGKDFVTVSSPVAFGSGQNTAGSFPGFVYWLPDNTQSIPTLDNMTPAGVVFARGFAVSANPYAQGFPGLDASRNEMFAIRYEADFVVAGRPGVPHLRVIK